jgi:hypothetical protein
VPPLAAVPWRGWNRKSDDVSPTPRMDCEAGTKERPFPGELRNRPFPLPRAAAIALAPRLAEGMPVGQRAPLESYDPEKV